MKMESIFLIKFYSENILKCIEKIPESYSEDDSCVFINVSV